MRLFLIRHAQSANNALPEEQRIEDPPITSLGHQQAKALAEWLDSVRLDHVVASPFRRSLETTEHIRRKLRLTPHVWIDLHEQGGCYAGYEVDRYQGRPGMTHEQIQAEFPDYQLDPNINGEGWWRCQPYETCELARARATRLLQRTLDEFGSSQQSIAYVMHADFKRLFLEQIFSSASNGAKVWASIFNTAVTVVEFNNANPRLDFYNSIAHLSPELLSK